MSWFSSIKKLWKKWAIFCARVGWKNHLSHAPSERPTHSAHSLRNTILSFFLLHFQHNFIFLNITQYLLTITLTIWIIHILLTFYFFSHTLAANSFSFFMETCENTWTYKTCFRATAALALTSRCENATRRRVRTRYWQHAAELRFGCSSSSLVARHEREVVHRSICIDAKIITSITLDFSL